MVLGRQPSERVFPHGALRAAALLSLALLAAAPVAADLKIVAVTEVDGLGQSGEGETVTVIRGLKSRSESRLGRTESVSLLDLDAREMTLLNARKKRAEVYDLSAMAQQQAGLETQKIQLEPTGNTREAAGFSCEDHRLDMSVEAGMEGMEMTVVIGGTVCLSKDAPGGEEYAAFYQAMAERGLFFGNPEAAEAQPGRERGMTELYRKLSESGVALITDLNIGFEGGGLMAAMMKRMKLDMKTTVTSISEESAAADAFAVPDGYRVKKK